MKKSMNNKKIIKNTIIILSVIIMIITITILSYIVYFNYKLDKLFNLTEYNNEEGVRYKYNFAFVVFSNKNKNAINSGKSKLALYNNNYEYYVNNVNNVNYINIKSKNSEYSFNNNEKTRIYVLNLSKNSSYHINNNIKVLLPDYLKSNKYVDVYKKENDELNIYLKSLEVIDGCINIDLDENNKKSTFVIAYIPLKDISFDSENLVINKAQQLDLSYNLYPENATDTAISCIASSDIVEIDGEKIIGKEAGETILTISNGIINKNINLKVNEVASDIVVSTDSVVLKVGASITVEAKVQPDNAINFELEWISDNEEIATVDNGKITLNKNGNCNITVKTKEEPIISKNINVSTTKIYPAPTKYNVEGLTYINDILLVNKKYSVPQSFAPGVNQTALSAFNDMKKEAARYGFNLTIISSYRSYSLQAGLYQKYTNLYGEKYASTISAKPGTSEHQTGLAFDISSLEESYGYTAEGKWLANNCSRYGFIIRYQKNKENITGYVYEPWHIRYLGTVKAQEVTNSGLCLEEYLGI